MLSLLIVHSISLANIEELVTLLKGKEAVYRGTCWFDKEWVLTFNREKRKTATDCIVAMALPDESKHYLILYRKGAPVRLVMYDEKTKKQVTLWIRHGT